MEKPADNDHPIEVLLRRRWSPIAFDDRPVEEEKLRSLLEAARWAASSYNEQPWAFLVARKSDTDEFRRALSCLVEGNLAWAQASPVLMLSVAKLRFDRGGKVNRHAFHDVGLAAGNLSIQATALDLAVHQMAGFHVDKARREYGIPDGWEPVAMIAVGYHGVTDELPESLRGRQESPRTRKPLSDFVYAGTWENKAPWLP